MARRNLRRIFTLTSQPEGPTGLELDRIAQEIVDEAKDNAAVILQKLVSIHPEVLDTIEFVRRGGEVRIGIRPDRPAGSNNVAFYLAQKEAREHVWLTPAVESVMSRHKHIAAVKGIRR